MGRGLIRCCSALLVPADGHINPAVSILAALVRRGERVVAWATETYRPQIESTGAEFRAYPEVFISWQWPNQGGLLAGVAARLECAEQMLPALLESIAGESPDYLLLDAGAIWGSLAAQILNLPAASITLAFAIHEHLLSEGELLRLLYGNAPASTLLQALMDMARMHETGRRLDKRFGTRTPGVLGALACRQQVNLVLTSKSFQPLGDEFDESYVFVGRETFPRPHAQPFPCEWIVDTPLIFISMGTVLINQSRFYQACFEAFADLPFLFVLATGRTVHPSPVPANFRLSESAPQLEVLKRASLFITHGGSNSVHEALLSGTPMVLYPQAADQFSYADRVTELGAGLRLPLVFDPLELRLLVLKVLGNPTYADQARMLGDSLRGAGNAYRAAEAVAALASRFEVSDPCQ